MSDFSRIDISSPTAPRNAAQQWSWAVSPEIVAGVKSEFTKHTSDGFISGTKAKELFIHSKVPMQDLANIWALSDRDADGKLSLEEFVIASILIFARKQGVAIPAALPAELTQSLATVMRQPSPNNNAGALSPAIAIAAQNRALNPTDASSPSTATKEKLKRGNSVASVGSAAGTKDKKKKKSSKWTVATAEKKKYREIFQEKAQGGYISGQLAVSLFTKSKLSREDLAKIWALADMDRDSQLSQQEFIVAMHLITKRVAGEDIPDTVPASLVESASSSAAKSKSPSLNRTASQASQPAPVVQQKPELVFGDELAFPSMGSLLLAEPVIVSNAPAATLAPQQAAVPAAAPAPAMMMMTNPDPLATNRPYASHTTTLAQLGIPDRVSDSYDPTADIARVGEISDLPALQQLLARVGEEVRNLKLQIEKQKMMEETMTERVSFKQQQTQLIQRRRQQAESIFQNYSEDIQNEEEDLLQTQEEIKVIISELEQQQVALRAAQSNTDQVAVLRQRKRELQQEFTQTKAKFNANRDEMTRLTAELEALRASDAASGMPTGPAMAINTGGDYGFQSEFDDRFDFTATNQSGNGGASAGFDDNFDFSAAATKFSFPQLPGTVSGTMTPTGFHDFEDSSQEPDTNWLGQTGLHTPAEPNTDFFNGGAASGFGGDANWADFGSGSGSESASSGAKRPRKNPSGRKAANTLKSQTSKKKVKDAASPSSPTPTGKKKTK